MSNTVFLRYRTLGNANFETNDGTFYSAISRHDISLVEVQEKHVPEMLLKMCGCCGSRFVCLAKASPEEIERWKS